MPRPSRLPRPTTLASRAAVIVLVAYAGTLSSCSREPRSRPLTEIQAEQQTRAAAAEKAKRDADAVAAANLTAPDTTTEIDLDGVPPGDHDDAEAQRRMAMLEQAINAPNSSSDSWAQPSAPTTPPGETSGTPDPALASTTGTPVSGPAESRATIVADASADATISPEQRLRLASDPLLATLRDQALLSESPVESLLRLAALETVRDDALPADAITGESPIRQLTPEERTLLSAWRDLHAGVRDEASAGDLASFSRLFTQTADRVRSLQPLSIVTSALCTRVERFGVYDELPAGADDTHKMVAGRPQRVLLYLELENYADRPESQGTTPGWSVDLTVGLTLHHLGRQTDLLAWRMSDETVHVFSRNHRREFFLSIVADLPGTISVDSYALKVTVKDQNSGALAERVLRIDMVADASALVSDAAN